MHYLYRYVCILNVFFYMCIWTIVCNKEFIIIIIYRISENVSIFIFYKNIHVHIAYYHCAKDQIKNRTLKLLMSRFKFTL